MIIQPNKEKRNVNEAFYKSERQRIAELNNRFFRDIDLTEQENKLLVWLCGWDDWTFDALISVLEKAGRK